MGPSGVHCKVTKYLRLWQTISWWLTEYPYIDKIRRYAAEQGYHVVDTTYGNTPIDFDNPAQAPVLSLRIDADIDSIAKVGKQLMQTVFHNTDTTPYDIVP